MSNNYLDILKSQLQQLKKQIQETQAVVGDPELKELAEKDLSDLEKQKNALEETINSIEHSPYTTKQLTSQTKSVIVEIRAAAGGNEAGLFAADLYRMYLKFADNQGWQVQQLSLNEGGVGNIKEVVFKLTTSSAAKSAYQLLQYESGVHRVQRIPLTEASGRIHTSTATVAVLPAVTESEVEIEPEDLEIETFRSSGPGGQHANKTESAVRITHQPTGVSASCQDSRSQLQNRRAAMDLLRARLHQHFKETKAEELGQERRQQIGQGERAEKIRTYNFPQDRVTDHRLNQSWYNISKIMDGEILPILNKLSTEIDLKIQLINQGKSI